MEHWPLMGGLFHLVQAPGPSSLYQMLQPAHQRPVHQLHIQLHITDALAILHWLRLPQRVDYTRSRSWRSECCMVWPRHPLISWLVLPTCLVATVCIHQHHTNYKYTDTSSSICRLSLVSGCCSHPLKLSTIWRPVIDLAVFQQRLTLTFLFHKSFPDVLLWCSLCDYASVVFVITLVILATLIIPGWHWHWHIRSGTIITRCQLNG